MTRPLQEDATQETRSDVLIVSAQPDHLNTLIRVLDCCSARVVVALSLRQAKEVLALHSFGIVFCEEFLSGSSYRELLSCLKPNESKFVLLFGLGDWPEYLEAMQLGAFDVLAFAPAAGRSGGRPTAREY